LLIALVAIQAAQGGGAYHRPAAISAFLFRLEHAVLGARRPATTTTHVFARYKPDLAHYSAAAGALAGVGLNRLSGFRAGSKRQARRVSG